MEIQNGSNNRSFEKGQRFRFDEFEIDPGNRLLLRHDETIPLTGKVFDVLVAFAENPGRLLGKEELLEKVWHGAFVEEGNLARNVSTLRKALGDTGKRHKYIATVQGRGYRFVAAVVTEVDVGNDPDRTGSQAPVDHQKQSQRRSIRWVVAVAVLVLLVGGWAAKLRLFPATEMKIKSLAVLPLKPIDASGNELGLGIADSIIRRISSTGSLIVRPTSSVRQYVAGDKDALTAAREVGTDAVLDGTVQRDNDRLRITVNLLRTSDGASLWTENFDMKMSDVFTIQDTVSQQIATQLHVQLDPEQTARLNKRSTSNPIAYEYYLKGTYSFDQRRLHSHPELLIDAAIAYFHKAVEADPNYALAYAKLGYAYCWKAISIDPNEKWVWRAREMIDKADAIDPQLAETHIARYLVLSSAYSGWRMEDGIRELLAAQRLDSTAGRTELAASYFFIGLEELGDREMAKALEDDPVSDNVKRQVLLNYWNVNRYDDWLVARERYFPADPFWPWYLVGKGRLDEAKKVLNEELAVDPDPLLFSNRAILSALKGESQLAEGEVPRILGGIRRENSTYKNAAYNIGCMYALMGKSRQSVNWLREAKLTGLSSYPLFERDRYLDPIRSTPEFMQFMKELGPQFERLKREFGGQ